MKYSITLICGHTERFDLFGKGEARERRASWIAQNRLCKECYQKELEREMVRTCELVTISYTDYKHIFPDCMKVKDSYDPLIGTIAVYIPYEKWETYATMLEHMTEAQARAAITEAKRIHGDDFWHHLNEKG